jgi:hypothetical protein
MLNRDPSNSQPSEAQQLLALKGWSWLMEVEKREESQRKSERRREVL